LTLAVILIQMSSSITMAKQEAACTEYVGAKGYELTGLIRGSGSSADAVAMVEAGRAQVVVVAYGGRDIAAAVQAAGGRIEGVHPTPHVVEPPAPPPPPAPRRSFPRSALDLLIKMRDRGHSPTEIAKLIGEDTGEIRRALRRRDN
jgi:hypothetical protein